MLVIVVAAQAIRGVRNPLVIAVAVVMVLAGAGRAAMGPEPRVPDGLATFTGATVTIDSIPKTSKRGASMLVTVVALERDGVDVPTDPFPVLLSVTGQHDLAPGDRLAVRWSVTPADALSPGFARYARAQGALATALAWNVTIIDQGPDTWHVLMRLRSRISDRLASALPGDAGALAAGIVTGDDTRLSPAADRAFLRTGTSHITAVSGSNIAMVLAIWYLVLPAGKTRRLLALQVAMIASIWVYAILVGLEPPAVRAALMATLIIVGSRFGRRPDPITILALTSAAMVLWNPRYVEMVSFWLSVVATAAIFSRIPVERSGTWQSAVREVATGVLLAQVATLPIVLAVFGGWSVAGVLANLLLAPLTWLAFPLSFALAFVALAAPWLAGLLGWAPMVPLQLTLTLVDSLSVSIPMLSLGNAGAAGVVAVSLPALLLGLLLVRDTYRWAPMARDRWRVNPWPMAVTVAGPAIGVAVAMMVLLLSR